MRPFLIIIVLLTISLSVCFGQGVGVNLDGAMPVAGTMLDVKGATDDNTTYAMQVKNSSGVAIMVVRSEGNVGIGTTTPSYKVDVTGEITSRNDNAFRMRNPGYSVFDRNDNSNYYMLLTNNGDPDGTWNALRPFRINLASGDVYLGNGSLYVDHGANVGVGTSSPLRELHVVGNQRIQGNFLEVGTGLTGNRYAYLDLNGDDSYANYSLRLLRANSGANAYSMIDHRGTGILYINARDAGSVRIRTNNTDRLTVRQNTGNVGIGTTAPTQKLDVNGRIRMRTGAANGRILRSSADGTGSWATTASVFGGALTVTGEYSVSRFRSPGTSSVNMVSTTRSMCFLTYHVIADTDRNAADVGCYVNQVAGRWRLNAYMATNDSDCICRARCLTW